MLGAVTILGPIIAQYIVAEMKSCQSSVWNGRPSGTAACAWIVLLPGSILSHLACAMYRKWVPTWQKADRIGICSAVVLQCWACSQNFVYTAVAGCLLAAVIVLVCLNPFGFKNMGDLTNYIVGGVVMYGLVSMQIPPDWVSWRFNPYFLPAAGAMCAGFAVFALAPVRSWTDALWHGFLTLYAVFTGLWTAEFERQLYDGCPGR